MPSADNICNSFDPDQIPQNARSNLDPNVFNQHEANIPSDTDVVRAHTMRYLREKMLLIFALAGDRSLAAGSKIKHSTTSL